MSDLSNDFLAFVLKREALKFGSFQTKSGRESPYFFNAGGLHLGRDLIELGRFYAGAIQENFGDEVDIIYGPAYKGIPLAVVTAMGLSEHYGREVSYFFNRKEAKDHGEKGSLVGRIPQPGERVVIVDDVITAGTAIRETMEVLSSVEGIDLKGVLVALDRQEKGNSEKSAIMEVEEDFGLPVKSIADLKKLLSWIENGKGFDADLYERIAAYRDRYGVEI